MCIHSSIDICTIYVLFVFDRELIECLVPVDLFLYSGV